MINSLIYKIENNKYPFNNNISYQFKELNFNTFMFFIIYFILLIFYKEIK